jgi:hypothetical protein
LICLCGVGLLQLYGLLLDYMFIGANYVWNR